MDFILLGGFTLLTFLAPFGLPLLIGLAVGSFSSKYRTGARELLRSGSITGAVCAAVVALFFFTQPELALPGMGHLMFIVAAFFAGLAATVGIRFVMQFFR